MLSEKKLRNPCFRNLLSGFQLVCTGFGRVTHVECACGTRNQAGFRLAYENTFADQNRFFTGMSRVAKPLVFGVHFGGMSPEPPSGSDDHKHRIGCKNLEEDVSREFQSAQKFQADFVCDMKAPGNVHQNETFPATFSMTNRSNLLDVAEVRLFGDTVLDTHWLKVGPGETRACTFQAAYPRGSAQNLVANVGGKIVFQHCQILPIEGGSIW